MSMSLSVALGYVIESAEQPNVSLSQKAIASANANANADSPRGAPKCECGNLEKSSLRKLSHVGVLRIDERDGEEATYVGLLVALEISKKKLGRRQREGDTTTSGGLLPFKAPPGAFLFGSCVQRRDAHRRTI